MPGNVFGKHLREKALEYIKAEYPDVYLGYPNNYPDFCLSLEDIKTARAESIASQKERYKEAIEVGDVNPGAANAPSADSNSGQSVKFELVQM